MYTAKRGYRPGDEPVAGYHLTKFLGKGQFGEVWQAKAPGGMHVALKLIDLGGVRRANVLRGRAADEVFEHRLPRKSDGGRSLGGRDLRRGRERRIQREGRCHQREQRQQSGRFPVHDGM